VGVNWFTTSEPSPLTSDLEAAIMRVDPAVEERAILALDEWRAERDPVAVDAALTRLAQDAATGANLMPASLACARGGVTTGEWSAALRGVFGEFRAPTGVNSTVAAGERPGLAELRAAVAATGNELGHRLRILVAKPGLDGHSNGAEQVAVAARDAGFEVVYQGIRLTPEEIVAAAVQEDVDCIGLSILSGSHLQVVPQVLAGLRAAGLDDVPVILGGIIPEQDARTLVEAGISAVFTPKDYDLTDIMERVLRVIRESKDLPSA
jgi:ethylmalonyl-CoA mutase